MSDSKANSHTTTTTNNATTNQPPHITIDYDSPEYDYLDRPDYDTEDEVDIVVTIMNKKTIK